MNLTKEQQAILDGAQENGKLLVIASTNHIEHIEEALLRSGRFGRLIKVGYPTAESRLAFVRKFEHKYDFKLPDNVVNEFVASTENVSIADIKGMLGYALRTSIRLHRPFDAACMHDVLRKFRHDSVKEGIGFIGRD